MFEIVPEFVECLIVGLEMNLEFDGQTGYVLREGK